MKGLRVTKNVKEITFEEVWGEWESKKKFPETITHKILRLTLVFMWNSAQRKSLISIFQEFSSSINKTFILAWRLGTRLSFYVVYSFPIFPNFLRFWGDLEFPSYQLWRHKTELSQIVTSKLIFRNSETLDWVTYKASYVTRKSYWPYNFQVT